MRITTNAFEGGWIPEQFTCDGSDVSPRIDVHDVPESAAGLALIVDDPDAPGGTFTHWLVWNLPPDTRFLPEGGVPAGARQGTNDFGVVGWRGPCPPRGRAHEYRFRLYALERELSLPEGARAGALMEQLRHGVIAEAELDARYARSRA